MISAAFSWRVPSWHPVVIVAILGLLIWYFEAVSRRETSATRRQKVAFAGGSATLLLASSWPIGDLARASSLAAIVIQRQLLVLLAAPMLLVGLPMTVTTRLTRPAPVDWIARHVVHPVTAIVVATLLLGLTALPIVIDTSVTSPILRGTASVAVLAAGVVLWLPVIKRVPGVARLSDMAKGGYLLAQSIAPTFLSFIWILALHPLYGSIHGQHAALGISPLTDQQNSGYLAKLGNFGVLWTVAFIFFVRSSDDEEEVHATLHWVDVERALERVERHDGHGSELLDVPDDALDERSNQDPS